MPINLLFKHKVFLILLAVTLLAAFLRLYKIESIPSGLSRDEVSIGYNAYSILKTGKDEYGRVLPLAFEAFGDWKLPLDIYFDVPFVALFGLSELAVRLPVALFGIASIPLLFFLGEEIRKKFFKEINSAFSLLAAFFLSVSPWHIYMSRTAFGHNVIALFFLILGLWFFLKSRQKDRYLFWAGLSFAATLFIYTSYHIFLPLFMFGLWLIFRQEISSGKWFKKTAFFLLAFFVVSQMILWKADITKVAGSSVFNDANMIYYRVERKINEHKNDKSFLVKIFHNKIITYPYQITLNYLSVFSPEFLFDKGGENPINNLEEMGNLYIADALLLVLGLFFLARNWNKGSKLLLLWLLLSPLPGAFTRDAPHSTRTFAMVGVLALIEAYGVVNLFSSFWQAKRVQNPFLIPESPFGLPRMTVIGIGLLLVFSYAIGVTVFLEDYFYHFSLNRARFWNYGMKQAVEVAKKENPSRFIMSKIYDSPYIFFLFFSKYDPSLYQKQAKRAALTWDGFRPVVSFGKYKFVEGFDWVHVWDSPNTLYIDAPENIPKNYPINGWINYPSGDKAYGWLMTFGNPCKLVYPSWELTPKICR